MPQTHFCESSLSRNPLLSCVNFLPNCYKSIKCKTKINCALSEFHFYHMNHMNGTDGVASHRLCFKCWSINCTFRVRPSDWLSAVGNLRFFDPQVAEFCGDKRRPFLGEGETKIFLNFLIAVEFLLLTVCLIFWDIG